MKRLLSSTLFCFLVLVLVTVPALGAELSGGYYLIGDSALGNDRTFYVPSDYAAGSLTYDSSGNLFNLTANSIYLYCPDYPDYTIYAPRFSEFQYRSGTGSSYNYVDLNLHDITEGNVEVFEKDPFPLHGADVVSIMILAVLIVGVGAFVLLKR